MVTATQGHLFPGNLDKPDLRCQKSPFSLFTGHFFPGKDLSKATFILL
jgi:hypothetical protein